MMKKHVIKQFYIVAAVSLILHGFFLSPVVKAQQDPSEIYETDLTEEMETLETGPIHEAFAETSLSETEPGIVVPKKPPDPINEIPPDRDDLEEGAQWISGYWAWDDDRNDFIWISGTYRVPPPGRQWVPGYWIEVDQGYQWISGYWADRNIEEAEYLPEPPESLDQGPNTEAPSPDYTWVPGCWVWYYGHYSWRPGYWVEVRPDWIWVPAYYVWTPYGYIYAGGYWDYPVVRRGILFAPVYFYPRFFARVFFPFTPGFVIGLSVFSDCIFVRPTYRHYYFGNYYASKYHKRGIYPWFSKYAHKHGYDPIYAHLRYTHRKDRHWEKNLYTTFKKRRNYEDKHYTHIEHVKKVDTNRRMTIVKDKGHTLPRNPKGNNSDIVSRKKTMKRKVERKNIGQKNQQVRKASDVDKWNPSQRGTINSKKPVNMKKQKKDIADKKGKKYNVKTSSYKNRRTYGPKPEAAPIKEAPSDSRLKTRNYKTPRTNPRVSHVQGTSMKRRLNQKNLRSPKPKPDVESVQETSNGSRLKYRNREQVNRKQNQNNEESYRVDGRIPDSSNRGNRQVTREWRDFRSKRYSTYGWQKMGNRRWELNGSGR